MIVKILLSVFPLFLLSGCGLINGESDYVPYTQALATHSEREAARIQSQSQAIVSSLSYARPQSDTERTLLSVIAMLQIQQLEPVPLHITKPTTGFDVTEQHQTYSDGTSMTLAPHEVRPEVVYPDGEQQ